MSSDAPLLGLMLITVIVVATALCILGQKAVHGSMYCICSISSLWWPFTGRIIACWFSVSSHKCASKGETGLLELVVPRGPRLHNLVDQLNLHCVAKVYSVLPVSTVKYLVFL